MGRAGGPLAYAPRIDAPLKMKWVGGPFLPVWLVLKLKVDVRRRSKLQIVHRILLAELWLPGDEHRALEPSFQKSLSPSSGAGPAVSQSLR